MSGDEDDTLPLSQFVRESGLGSNKYSLSIDVNPVTEITETPDNIDIIRSMKDLNRELTKKWLPAVGKWLEARSSFLELTTCEHAIEKRMEYGLGSALQLKLLSFFRC